MISKEERYRLLTEQIRALIAGETDMVAGVLDIDSKELATFDDTDRHWLEKICGELKGL